MNEIEQLIKIGKKHQQINKITLFGSRARGDNHDRSDYDIAIYLRSNNSRKIFDDIDEIETLLKIDVTFITPNNTLDKVFLNDMKADEEVIYLSKFEKRYANLIKAVKTLEEVIEQEKTNQNEVFISILRDSLIQRFEYCYEMSWKAIREYIISSGVETGTFPRTVLETAYQKSLIDAEAIWLNMIKDRNISSHEYNEEDIDQVAQRIRELYFKQFVALIEKLKEEY